MTEIAAEGRQMTQFEPDEFAFLAHELRENGDHGPAYKALLSNNYNVILAALDIAASTGKGRETLSTIAEMRGKTLISMEHGQAYSIGANAAFEQCADTAQSALGERLTPPTQSQRTQ